MNVLILWPFDILYWYVESMPSRSLSERFSFSLLRLSQLREQVFSPTNLAQWVCPMNLAQLHLLPCARISNDTLVGSDLRSKESVGNHIVCLNWRQFGARQPMVSFPRAVCWRRERQRRLESAWPEWQLGVFWMEMQHHGQSTSGVSTCDLVQLLKVKC